VPPVQPQPVLAPLTPAAIFLVVTINDGGEATVHDALHAYLKAHSPIDPRREGRVRATDLPETVWSQYGMLRTLWHIPGDAAGVAMPEHPEVAK